MAQEQKQKQKDAELKEIVTDSDSEPPFHPGRIIVRFKNDKEPKVIPTPNPMAEIARLRNDDSVLYAEPDFVVRTDTTTPTDPLWPQQWDMAKISAPQAWDTQSIAGDVIVAVFDTGIDYKHPDLQANLWVNPADGSHGFTCLNGSCAAGGQDDYGHGTHVAGTIGASANNGQGMAGINWRTQLLSCKFLGSNGSGSVSDALLCYNKILTLKQQGFNIRVINNSWGGGGYSQALKDAMAAVEATGVLDVCAAGNSGLNVDIAPMYPGAYDNRGIVSVLASDANDAGASFTNFGVANVDIAAPGVTTLSTVPVGNCPLCSASGYASFSGTSMATPHVAGVAAALFHLNGALTASQARDVLLDPSSYDAVTDARAVLTSTGGRLNFLKAITSPLLHAPVTNNFPTISGVSNISANAGSTMDLTAAVSDPDNDPLRMSWVRGPANAAPGAISLWLLGSMYDSIFPSSINGNSMSFQAPSLALPAVASYSVSVSDGRGGGVSALANATILPAPNPGLPPTGTLTVSPTSGPVGTVFNVNFPVTDPEGGQTAWDIWQMGTAGGYGYCCQTGTSYSIPINVAGAYRITTQAIDEQLNISNRQSVVVRTGGYSGTPPIANAVFDKLTGTAPLTVNIDMRASVDPDGTIQQSTIECMHGASGTYSYGPTGNCVYDTPGNYWIFLKVKDNDGLWDALTAYAIVTSPQTPPPPPPPPPPSYGTIVIRTTTLGGTGTFPFTTAGTGLTDFSLATTAAGSTVSKTFANLGAESTGGSRTIAESALPAGWQLTDVKCSSLTGSTVSVSGAVATIFNLVAGDTVTCDYTATLPPTNTTPPSVSLTNPKSGTVKKNSTVMITGAVTPGTNPVTKVDFILSGKLKCSTTAAPYSCEWKVPAAAGKAYILQAIAYDSEGKSGKSSTVTVTAQ